MIDVSIIIVCMNKLTNLYPCLESINRYHTVTTETIVTAYMFSKENLEEAKKRYPWVKYIENNEISGFSANNNLALRQAQGKYCFILNDDTKFDTDVVGDLVRTFDKLNDEKVAIVSPNIILPDGRVQYCGRPKATYSGEVISQFRINKLLSKKSKYTDKEGIFLSYNVMGAAFMIRTDLFKQIGWFDERYYFCPEDIAVSTTLNRRGYTCWVNADVHLTHIGGGSIWSPLLYATRPAGAMGALIFYSEGSTVKNLFMRLIFIISSIMKWTYFSLRRPKSFYRVKALGEKNVIIAMFGNKTPKEIFVKHYMRKY